jgi:hypothetical protein
VSLPQFPSPEQYGRPGYRSSWEQPGLIPLRPLTVGEVLGAAVTVVRRHFVPLGGAAMLVGLLSTICTLGLLSVTGALQTYTDGLWLQNLLDGASTSVPSGILIAIFVGLLVTTIGGPVIAGMATAYAGAQALGRDGRGAVNERLRGRWMMLLGTAAIVGTLVAVGFTVLIIPGVIAYLIWVFAAPAVVMERATVSPALRRSALLTRGHRLRILGTVAVTMIAGAVASALFSGVVAAMVAQSDAVTVLVITQLVGVVIGGFAAAWTGAAVALLYIDVRMRTEHLDQALRSAAAADLGRINPPGQPGY